MPQEDHHRMEDRCLLAQMRENDSNAFEALYDKYWEQVYAGALNRLRDPASAKDITQDIFLKLWARRQHLVIDNLPAYLYTSVRNNVLKWLEKEQKYVPLSELLLELETSPAKADAALLTKEFMAAYNSLIATLTPAQQIIFKMRYQQELSTMDIASSLNISRKTVQNQLGKSLARLRESLLLCFSLFLFLFPG